MPVFLPLILVALGSLSVLVLRDGRAVLVGLGAQWLGLIGTIIAGTPPGANSLGVVAVEGVTLLVCLSVLFITLRNLRALRLSTLPGLSDQRRRLLLRAEEPDIDLPPRWSREGLVDQAWLWGVGLVVGIAGFGLARLYNLGAREDGILAFYWIALSGMVTLVVHGTRDGVKLSAGLVALLNAVALALYLLGLTAPGPVALGLLSAGRTAVCLVLAYAWMLLKVTFMSVDLGLGGLFDGRDGHWATETALVVSGPPPVSASQEEEENGDKDEEDLEEPVHVTLDSKEVFPDG
jgi:hypothetical protein